MATNSYSGRRYSQPFGPAARTGTATYLPSDTMTPAFVNMVSTLGQINYMKAENEQKKIEEFNNLLDVSLEGITEQHTDELVKDKEALETEALDVYRDATGKPNYFQQKELNKKKQAILRKAGHSKWLKEQYKTAIKDVFDNLKMVEPESMVAIDKWFRGVDADGNKLSIENTPDPHSLIKWMRESELENWSFTDWAKDIKTSTYGDGVSGKGVDMKKLSTSVDAFFDGPGGYKAFVAGANQGLWKNMDEAKEYTKEYKAAQVSYDPKNKENEGGGLTFNYVTGKGGDDEANYTYHPDLVDIHKGDDKGHGFVFAGDNSSFMIGGGSKFTPLGMYYDNGALTVDGVSKRIKEIKESRVDIDQEDIYSGRFLYKGTHAMVRTDEKGNKYFMEKGNGRRLELQEDKNRGSFYFYTKYKEETGEERVKIEVNKIKPYLESKFPGIIEYLDEMIEKNGTPDNSGGYDYSNIDI